METGGASTRFLNFSDSLRSFSSIAQFFCVDLGRQLPSQEQKGVNHLLPTYYVSPQSNLGHWICHPRFGFDTSLL